MPDQAVPVDAHGINHAAASPTCALLVCSCDAYADLWQPFFQLFWRHWPDCPFPIYLGAGEKSFDAAKVHTLHSPDKNWTSSFRHYLGQICADYVLLLLEDFFLDLVVDSNTIQARLQTLHELEAAVLRLTPKPGPDLALPSHAGIGRLSPDAPYRVSLQAAIWNRRDLLALLVDGESPWQFEWNGTERSRRLEKPFLATEEVELSYRHVIERGAWFWSAARKYRREAICCDFSVRPVMGPVVAAKKALNRMRKQALDSFRPPGARRRR